MTFPDEIFPEDKIDPTVAGKDAEMSVEQTLGIVGHVKTSTKKRKNWRYLRQDVSDNLEAAETNIREFYGLPSSATVVHRGSEWAVWAAAGDPTSEAFEPEPESKPESHPILSEVLKNAPSGTALEIEAGARDAAFGEANAKKIDEKLRETWAYSTNNVEDLVAMRERYGAGPDAPVEMHTKGDIAAIWLGKGPPTRPAFPGESSVPAKVSQSTNGNGASSVIPVKVSPFAPAAALNDMGIKFYALSKEPLFTDGFRKFLLQVSDSLHAEAARMELSKVRQTFDGRKKP
jgi:hypothetical protein